MCSLLGGSGPGLIIEANKNLRVKEGRGLIFGRIRYWDKILIFGSTEHAMMMAEKFIKYLCVIPEEDYR